MIRFFQPGAGRFGVQPAFLSTTLGTVTANQTNTFNVGQVHRLAVIARLAVSLLTIPVDADGTLLLTFKKYDASADAAIALNTAVNLESIAAAKESEEVALLSTLTDSDLLFEEGDTLFVEVVSNSAAIDTAAVGVVVSAEFLLRK